MLLADVLRRVMLCCAAKAAANPRTSRKPPRAPRARPSTAQQDTGAEPKNETDTCTTTAAAAAADTDAGAGASGSCVDAAAGAAAAGSDCVGAEGGVSVTGRRKRKDSGQKKERGKVGWVCNSCGGSKCHGV